MAGILDLFDSPDMLSRLFGGSPSPTAERTMAAAVPPTPPPQPPMQPPPQVQVAQAEPPPIPDQMLRTREDVVQPRTVGGIGSDAARSPNVPQPDAARSPNVPVPLPSLAPPAPTAAPMPSQVQPAPPVPMPPPSYFENAPAAETSGGGLRGALGIDRRNMRSAMQGIGKGFTAAAKPGMSKGQAFAAGAGASMEGTSGAQEREENTLFQQSSIAFKDMLAAQGSKNNEAYRQAQGAYLMARAKALEATTAAGGKGTNAWQNTPFGQVAVIEQRVMAFDTPRRKSIDAQVRAGTLSGDDAKRQYEDLDKKAEQYRQNLYKHSKIDPKEAEKLKTMGESPSNPFDTKGMTIEQFHSLVPMGAWFKDQSGTVRQRTKPPGGAEAPAQAPAQSTAATTHDDDMAMSGEAA